LFRSHPFSILSLTFKTAIMKNSKQRNLVFIYCIIALFLVFGFQTKLHAQNRSVTSYQYRHVPNDKIDEFIKRETTYWSKVAQKAVDNKTMSFWALFEKVGGYDLPNSSNYLFINTYPDIDKAGGMWDAADIEKTAGVKMADMDDNSFTTVTSEFFLHGQEWAQAAKSVPAKDFNYVEMVYHNTDYPDSLINLEKKYWTPFIKDAMDKGQTPQVAWGNAIVLAPAGDNIKFTTVSYDLYKTLGDALMPVWDPKTVLPVDGLGMIQKLETSRRGIAIYRVVKVVSAP
jgi:hypothetical protein